MTSSPATSTSTSTPTDTSVTDEQLWAWIRDENPTERQKAAGYMGLSTEMVNELSRDSDVEVVAALAANPSVSPVALEVLAQIHRKPRPAYFGRVGIRKSPPHSIALALLRNPGLPEGALRELALSTALEVRMGIAKHPNTPSEILLRYAKDSPELHEALLVNPNLPESVRTTLRTQIQRQQDAQNKLERPQNSTLQNLFNTVAMGLMGVLVALSEGKSMEEALVFGGVVGAYYLFRWLYMLILEMEKDEQNTSTDTSTDTPTDTPTDVDTPTETQTRALEKPRAHEMRIQRYDAKQQEHDLQELDARFKQNSVVGLVMVPSVSLCFYLVEATPAMHALLFTVVASAVWLSVWWCMCWLERKKIMQKMIG